jgi:hypothetical protein
MPSPREGPTCYCDRGPGKSQTRGDVVPVLAIEGVLVVHFARRGNRAVDGAEPRRLDIAGNDERIHRILGIRERREVDVADPAVDLFGQSEELVPHTALVPAGFRLVDAILRVPIAIVRGRGLSSPTPRIAKAVDGFLIEKAIERSLLALVAAL